MPYYENLPLESAMMKSFGRSIINNDAQKLLNFTSRPSLLTIAMNQQNSSHNLSIALTFILATHDSNTTLLLFFRDSSELSHHQLHIIIEEVP